MKKHLITGILACILISLSGTLFAQTAVTLDTAINNTGKELSSKLKQGSKVAILSMSSSSVRLSTYVIEELTSALVNQRQVTVVDRSQLDLLQREMNFQYSGEVSDASAQAIGKKLGAQAIITGSFEPLSDFYRFRVKVIEVETAVISITYSANVQNDRIVASLMSDSGAKPLVSNSKAVNYGEDDFTTGQRWGTWALNAFTVPGLGSLLVMQDKVGFRDQMIMGLGGSALFWIGYFVIDYSEEPVKDSYGRDTGEYEGTSPGEEIGSVMVIAGMGLWIVNGIYNIVRSSIYHKSSTYTGSLFDPSVFNIVLIPAKDGKIDKVHLSYTLHF